MNRLLLACCNILLLFCFTTNLKAQDRPYLTLLPGMELSRDLRFAPYEYNFHETDFQPIIIQGENFILDFSGAKLYGTEPSASPDQYRDVAIIIRNARNVKIENLNIHRFHVAIYIENSENIHFRNCDFSYNQRPKLYSDRNHIIFTDSIQTVQLGQGELAAFSAFNSRNCTLESVKISHGQHGIIFKNCEEMDVFNSIFTFNSGIGIALVNSHQNQIRHCRLDYHNRGVSYGGLYQDFGAAGILMTEGSTNNQIGYNSITHCDKGIVQKSFDKSDRTPGLNNFHKNDFSFCPMVGLELNGDSAIVQQNIFNENRLGLFGKGPEHININNNIFSNHHIAIQLESSLKAGIRHNEFKDSQTGVFLPKPGNRKGKKSEKVDTYDLTENRFDNVENPFVILDPSGTNIQSNIISGAAYIPSGRRSNNISFRKNIFHQFEGKKPSIFFRWRNKFSSDDIDTTRLISPMITTPNISPVDLPMNTEVWPYLERGIKSIMLSEYGPYDFKYPFLYVISGYPLRLKVMGPNDGAWSLEDERGIEMKSASPGTFPDTIEIQVNEQVHFPYLKFKYTGRSFPDQQGRSISPEDTFYFHYPENKNRRFVTFRNVDDTHSFSNCESSTMKYFQSRMDPERADSIDIVWSRISLPVGSYKLTCFDVEEPYVCMNNEMMRLSNLPYSGQSELPIEVNSSATSLTIFKNKSQKADNSSCLLEKSEIE